MLLHLHHDLRDHARLHVPHLRVLRHHVLRPHGRHGPHLHDRDGDDYALAGHNEHRT